MLLGIARTAGLWLEIAMSLTTLATAAVVVLCSTIGFLFGAIWGRKTAYKIVRTWDDQF
jgi:hypothetical protein